MALTLSALRDAIGAQLRENLQREINVDVDGAGKPAPVIRLALDAPPAYYESFGPPRQLQSVTFLVEIDPAGADQSAVRRLDDFLSSGTGNGSSVIDALDADSTFGGVAQGFDYEPRDYDRELVVASFAVTVHVQDS
jgi:hypothetical protein